MARADDVSIVLCGQAGMGIQTVESILTRMLKLAGYNVFATKEYMSRVRGGNNSTQIRVSSGPVSAFVNRIDLLIPLNKGAVQHLGERISQETIVLAETEVIGDEAASGRFRFVEAPFTKIATDIGNKVYSNVVAAGTLAGLLGMEMSNVCDYVKQFFSSKPADIVQSNVRAAEAGFRLSGDLAGRAKINFNLKPDAAVKNHVLLAGGSAVGLGAIAGGCNFVSSYPMSPSTSVLTFLAKNGGDFGIIVEQAEDEIAAINMAIGAWYAGARAMVTTSGGGFALMVEGLSLAGMLESPVVIHLGQRPGPATGLPTRTEQADLEFALYSGHGEFPRILFAPGTIEQAFYLTARAFNLADKYQAPVFVMTDQYFMDSYYNTGGFDLSSVKVEKYITETAADYKRYELTENGISPRGVPCFGQGLVCADSDEHDAEGHITEDLQLRTKMVDKRLRKLESIRAEIVGPELYPNREYDNLVVCWGSTCNIVREAVAALGREDTSVLHYSQVYPLHPQTAEYLSKAKRVVVVEGNATGQFAKLIKLHTGIDIKDKILKYSGLSFAVEEVADALKNVLK
ncbi:MAG: 2-oxoacid:acceptor oxidoreductase subunit alpha [Phycisphaerae bacterium]|nr:2-oxoacid:acceptor oxidoreductase subunit alpha [Phycisphaerae bacterium]MDD5380083.1 2-oxoacid:acceptor oxidoreductase subunit alpha [Phycisphaerae bacterium]